MLAQPEPRPGSTLSKTSTKDRELEDLLRCASMRQPCLRVKRAHDVTSRSERTNPMAGDSFQRAREVFFGCAKAAVLPSVFTAELLEQKSQPLARPAIEPRANHSFRVRLSQELTPEPSPGRQESSRSRPLSASIVFSRDEIANLDGFVGRLLTEPGMAAPRFFLASVLERKWRPCVVVVSREGRTVGLLYCKERLVAGIGTRIAFGDDALGTMLVADPHETESIFQCAVTTLLRHMLGVRLLISTDRLSLLKGIRKNEGLNLSPAKRHSHLGLPRTYDEFLAKIGPQLRHNLRRYRRKSEIAGNEFSPDQPFPEFCAAVRSLFPNSAYAKSKSVRVLDRSLAMIEAMPSRLLTGLRGRNGEWLSVAGGWYVGDRAIINMQLNDCRFVRDSFSLVLRSYLIEALIKQGFRELVFWVGISGPLSFYCDSPDQQFAYIDAPSMWWRLFRRSFTILRKFGLATFRKSPLKFVVSFPACTPEKAVLYIR